MSPPAVSVERRVVGTPADVFGYFTDPTKHVLWLGSWVDLDPRPGGAYVVHFDDTTRIAGEYLVVDPPSRIVLTWGWESRHPTPGGLERVPPGSTRVEIQFVADGAETIVKVLHSGLDTAEQSDFTTTGWTHYLTRLDSILDPRSGAPGPDDLARLLASTERDDDPT